MMQTLPIKPTKVILQSISRGERCQRPNWQTAARRSRACGCSDTSAAVSRRMPRWMSSAADGDDGPVYLRKATLLIAAGLLLGIVIRLYAGEAWPIVVYRLGTDGALVALWVLACVG